MIRRRRARARTRTRTISISGVQCSGRSTRSAGHNLKSELAARAALELARATNARLSLWSTAAAACDDSIPHGTQSRGLLRPVKQRPALNQSFKATPKTTPPTTSLSSASSLERHANQPLTRQPNPAHQRPKTPPELSAAIPKPPPLRSKSLLCLLSQTCARRLRPPSLRPQIWVSRDQPGSFLPSRGFC